MAYVDAQKGQSHRDLIFEMKQFKQNGPQTPPLWVVLNNLWVQEWKIKPPREQEITLSKKPKQPKVLLELNIFIEVIWEIKTLPISLYVCKVQVPANRNVAEGDLILITAFSQAFDVFTSSVGLFVLGFFLFGFGFLFVFYLFPVTQEGKNEAQKLEIWSLWQIWYWSGTLLF